MSVNRRDVLVASAGVGAGLMLAGCSGDDGSGAKSGGTLRIGALGKASAATRDPHGVLNNESDFLIASLVYDALTVGGKNATVAPRLMESWEADKAQEVWRFTIAENAAFHDGTPVIADDVVWSLKRLRKAGSGATKVPVDADAIQADGKHTVVLTSAYPNSQLPMLLRMMTFVLPENTKDIAKAPGTGPFKLKSYDKGNAHLVRNDDWHGGKPRLDAIEVTMFDDPQSMSNALLGGQIDLASNAGPIAARSAEDRDDITVTRRENDMAMPIVMRTSDGPFADKRVREALRLAVDRKAMVKQVLSGYGTIGNDVLGTADPHYDTDLPQRERDLDRARELLKEAEFDLDKTYEIITTEEIFGLAESAEVFAEQVGEAGVTLEVVKQDSTVYNEESWLKAPLHTTYWGTNDSVEFFASKVLNSEAAWNETAFDDAKFDDAYHKAISSGAEEDQVEASKTMQKIQYDRGGYLLWGVADGIDLASKKVRGLPELPGYGRVQLEKTWIAS